jgi:hypothetical protein
MTETLAQFRAAAARYRAQSTLIGGSIIALLVFVAVGVRVRRAAEPLRAETTRLSAAAAELSEFRAAFVPSTPEGELRLSLLADSLGGAVARDDRMALAQRVAASAEALGLTRVRVRFTPADSITTPARSLMNIRTKVADYSLAIDAVGSFSTVLELLGQLPTSIVLERLAAVRALPATQYRLSFAILEATSHRSGEPLADLMSVATPVADSIAAPAPIGSTSTLSRDPFAAGAARVVVRLAAQPVQRAPKVDAPAWDVTATLIAGARRAALINGVLVSVGDAVPGGVTLTSVERDRVVLTDQKGATHMIAVKEGER